MITTDPIRPDRFAREWDAITVGTARPVTDDWPVDHLVLHHHRRLALGVASWIEGQAAERFSLTDANLVHRVGEIGAGEVIVVCFAKAAGEHEASSASRWMLEKTKHGLPVWKQEVGPLGVRWVPGEPLELPQAMVPHA